MRCNGLITSAAFCLLVGLVGRAQEPGKTPEPGETQLAESNFALGCDLYKLQASGKDNIFISPHSIANALAIVRAGARGNTAKEIDKVLHAEGQGKEFDTSFALLNKRLQTVGTKGGQELLIANAFWKQKELPLLPGFVETCRKNYDVQMGEADFISDPDAACLSINRWVEDKTKAKIKNLVNRNLVDQAKFVLVNTIYFNGKWAIPFNKAFMREGKFLVNHKEHVSVPMMSGGFHTGYVATDDLQAVEIPYAECFSLCAIVPKTEKAFKAFESGLTPQKWMDLRNRMTAYIVDVTLPKFKLESRKSLSGDLIKLGMVSAFEDARADLSGMLEARTCIKEIIHQSCLEVNEKGTEAVAATATVGFTPLSAPGRVEKATIVLDRPFFVLIRDEISGVILFMGRVMDPVAGK